MRKKNAPKPWTCTQCKKPIASGDGYIVVMDPVSKGYPQTDPKPGDPRANVEFDVLHHNCDPYPNASPYGIDVEHASSLELWCHKVHHLAGKTWMGRFELQLMLELWFSNRGEDIHTQKE